MENTQGISDWSKANITGTHRQPGFRSWECKHDTREARRNAVNDEFPKEILGENHLRGVSNWRHAIKYYLGTYAIHLLTETINCDIRELLWPVQYFHV